jgi:hypothetical protein
MDKKTFALGCLSIIATILFVANLTPTPVAQAAGTVIKDRDYTLATTRSVKGGEILYIMDNRTGQIASLSVGANRTLEPIAVNSLTSLSAK